MKAITGITLIDGIKNKPEKNAVILVNEEGKIDDCGKRDEVEIPEKVEEIDFANRTVLPGLIDSHVHLCLKTAADPISTLIEESDARTALTALKNAQKLLASGITTARDLGGKNYISLDIRDVIKSGEKIGPHILGSGRILAMTGGHCWQIAEEINGETEARRGARKQIKKGADQIKVMATGGIMTEGVEPGAPQLTEDEMRGAIEEAHKADRKTAAHAQGLEGIKNAIRAGIDSIEHGVFLDEEAVNMMRNNGVFLVPTRAAIHLILDKGEKAGIPAYMIEKSNSIIDEHLKNFRMALSEGVRIALGTDAGSTFNEPGNMSLEIKLMVEMGMSPMQAIKSATANSAKLLGIDQEAGTISPGKRADLLVLKDNPINDIENIEKVHAVFLQGEQVDLDLLRSKL